MKAIPILFLAFLAGCGGPKLIWEAEPGKPQGPLAPALSEGLVLFSAEEGLLALDLEEGQKRWTWSPRGGGKISGLRAVPSRGAVVLAGGRVTLLDLKNGSELGSLESRGKFLGEAQEALLPVSDGSSVQMLEAGAGSIAPVSSLSLDSVEALEAAASGDTAAFIFRQDEFGGLGAFNFRSGALLWQTTLAKPLAAAPVFSGDFVVVGEGQGTDPVAMAIGIGNGLVRWRHAFHQAAAGPLSVKLPPAKMGSILAYPVYGPSGAELLGLDAATGKQRWAVQLDKDVSAENLSAALNTGSGACLAAGDELLLVSEAGEITWKRGLKGGAQGLAFLNGILAALSASGHLSVFKLSK